MKAVFLFLLIILSLTNTFAQSNQSNLDLTKIQSSLEELTGNRLSEEQIQDLKMAREYVQQQTDNLDTSESQQLAHQINWGPGRLAPYWIVLACAGAKTSVYITGQASLCVNVADNLEVYSVLGLGAGVSQDLTADLGILMINMVDGQIEGDYAGVQTGFAAGWVGAGAGLYFKINSSTGLPSTWGNRVLRARYTPGVGLDASVNKLFIRREIRL